VDPRLLAAVSGGASRIDDDDASVSLGSDTDDDLPSSPSAPSAHQETKEEKMARLVREYEQSVQDAKDDGCLMCGS
jgi:hypothetical protein